MGDTEEAPPPEDQPESDDGETSPGEPVNPPQTEQDELVNLNELTSELPDEADIVTPPSTIPSSVDQTSTADVKKDEFSLGAESETPLNLGKDVREPNDSDFDVQQVELEVSTVEPDYPADDLQKTSEPQNQEQPEEEYKSRRRRSTKDSIDPGQIWKFAVRAADTDDRSLLSGDFIVRFASRLNLSLIEDEFEEESIEEYITEIHKPIFFERQIFIERLQKVQQTNVEYMIRNSILSRQVRGVYRKRNMAYVYREEEVFPDMLDKYHKKLIEMDNLLNRLEFRRNKLSKEILYMQEKANVKKEQLETGFRTMQLREQEVAAGLVYSKTGNRLNEKTILTYIRRQGIYFHNIVDLRKKFHFLKAILADREAEIDKINCVGEGLYLMNYELLRNENRIYTDKIEEKDNELSLLRSRYISLVEILAHVREKSIALDSDISDLQMDVNGLEKRLDERKRNLNQLRQERDNCRLQLEDLKIECGLLAETSLLMDMEKSREEQAKKKKKLLALQDTYFNQLKQLRNLRRTRENIDTFKKRARKPVPKKISQHNQFKSKPATYTPILPPEAVESLKDQLNIKQLS